MATKEISQLPSTNVSNDTDLLMTRQGSQDRAVQVETVRNVGTDPGQSLGVGGYGIGGNAISITSLYASNNANLIDRSGVYAVAGATNVPVAVGELKHWQTSATEATQEVIGQNQEAYFRKKVAGTWLAWVLYGAANKATVRADLGVPANNEALLIANSLQEIEDAGGASQTAAQDNIGLPVRYEEIDLRGGDFSSDINNVLNAYRIGDQVTLTWPSLTLSSSMNDPLKAFVIPSKFTPPDTFSQTIQIINVSATEAINFSVTIQTGGTFSFFITNVLNGANYNVTQLQGGNATFWTDKAIS